MRPKPHTARWFCKNDPEVTAQPLFDGVLREKLKTWGYNDNEALSKEIENDCYFHAYHHIKPAFDELGLDTRARKDGGPNVGFRIDHQDGPAMKRKKDGTLPDAADQYHNVSGKEYRVRLFLAVPRSRHERTKGLKSQCIYVTMTGYARNF